MTVSHFKLVVNHIDGRKGINKPANLERMT